MMTVSKKIYDLVRRLHSYSSRKNACVLRCSECKAAENLGSGFFLSNWSVAQAQIPWEFAWCCELES